MVFGRSRLLHIDYPWLPSVVINVIDSERCRIYRNPIRADVSWHWDGAGPSPNMNTVSGMWFLFYSLRPRRNGRYNADDILKCIFLKENVWIPPKISLKFVPKGPINNIPALVQIMAWRRPGDKPLSEPMMVRLLTHICVTRPQWVKGKTVAWPTVVS